MNSLYYYRWEIKDSLYIKTATELTHDATHSFAKLLDLNVEIKFAS